MIELTQPEQTLLERLLSWKGATILSLYMPVATAGPDKRENAIRFKGLLASVKSMLADEGWSPGNIEAFLQPLTDSFGPEIWEGAGQPGFALFYQGPGHEPLSQWLPREVPELCTLHGRVHVKPLLDVWNRNRPFLLIAPTHDRLSLHRGDAFGVEQFHDPDIPETAKEALGVEAEIESIQYHTGTPPSGTGDRAAVFHGQGGPDNVREDRMRRFFQRVAGPLKAAAEREKRPVVLCGLPEVLSVFRHETDLPGVLSAAVDAHPNSLDPGLLRERAAGISRREKAEDPGEVEREFRQYESKLRSAGSVDEVLPLAATGRIQTLYAARDHEVWGRFHPDSLKIEHVRDPAFGREDLLDTCVRAVHETGGEVRFLNDEEVSEHLGARHVAAILRPTA